MDPQEIIRIHEANMKFVKSKLEHRTGLMEDVIAYIKKYEEDEKERFIRGTTSGENVTLGEPWVKARREAQQKKERKAPAELGMCTLDPDGAHQPVRIKIWKDELGPLENGDKEMDRRFVNLKHWSQKLYLELFIFLEPSLFGGVVPPTDSNTVLRLWLQHRSSCRPNYNTTITLLQAHQTRAIRDPPQRLHQ